MKSDVSNAIVEILLTGKPFTVLEANVLFGASALSWRLGRLRHEGFVFDRERVSLETVYRRLDATLRQRMPRPRYVETDTTMVTQWRRNKSQESRHNAPVHKKNANAARLQIRRTLHAV